MPKLLEARGLRCCGSSWGWLITEGHQMRNIFFLNPFTRIQIQLPTWCNLPRLQTTMPHPRWIRKALFLSPPTVARFNLDDHNNTMVVQRMVAHDCVVVAINCYCFLFFCRLANEAWAAIAEKRCEDIILYHDQLYVITASFELLYVGLGPYPKLKSCNIAPPEGEVGGSGDHSDKQAVYLVECLGELLMVIRRWDLVCSIPDPDWFCNCQFNNLHLPKTNVLKIFKLDPKGLCWTPLENLGNQMLFVGLSEAISLSALDCPSFRGNTIYFTQQNFGVSTSVKTVPHACNDTGVFYLEDKSFKPLFLDDGVSLFLLLSAFNQFHCCRGR